ncbi:hypothetical protein BC832DRAFT_560220 [Gaertneriomyces semiglobifer]|nr:hypothetical protein BC832DRAFT_560220 [Gaertneriomyces semiglobifer]
MSTHSSLPPHAELHFSTPQKQLLPDSISDEEQDIVSQGIPNYDADWDTDRQSLAPAAEAPSAPLHTKRQQQPKPIPGPVTYSHLPLNGGLNDEEDDDGHHGDSDSDHFIIHSKSDLHPSVDDADHWDAQRRTNPTSPEHKSLLGSTFLYRKWTDMLQLLCMAGTCDWSSDGEPGERRPPAGSR